MALPGGGPTVTLTFKGDTDDLKRKISDIAGEVGKIGLVSGAILGIGAAAGLAVGSIAAIPLAFAAIGVAAQAGNEQVKAAFTGLKDHVLAEVRAMTVPFQAETIKALGMVRAAFDAARPELGQLFAQAAPMLSQFTAGLLSVAVNALPGFVTAIGKSQPVVDALNRGLGTLGTALGGFFANLSVGGPGAASILDSLFKIIGDLLPPLGRLIGELANALAPAVKDAAGFFEWLARAIDVTAHPLGVVVGFLAETLPIWGPVVAGIYAVIKAVQLWEAAQVLLNIVLAANPIGLVVVAVAALAAGVIYCYQHFESFRDIVDAVWAQVKRSVEGAVTGIGAAIQVISEIPGRVGAWFVAMRDRIVAAVAEVPGIMQNMAAGILRAAQDLALLPIRVLGYFAEMVTGGRVKADDLVNMVTGLPGRIVTALGDIGRLLYDSGVKLLTGFLDGIKAAAGSVVDGTKAVVTDVRGLFPGSPAKWGPFSGAGYTDVSGRKLIEDFGRGITEAAPRLAELARTALAGARFAISGFTGQGGTISGSAPGLGSVEMHVAPGVDSALSSLLMNLVRTGQLQLQRAG